MGVVISTTALSPLSLTSTIIGLVSFAFTVATFIRVVWTSLENVCSYNQSPCCPSEILTG